MPTVRDMRPADPSFSVCFFHTDPSQLDDSELDALKRIGVTHLSIQLFLSPGDNPVGSLSEFCDKWDQLRLPSLSRAIDKGFRIVGRFDDSMRNDGERLWMASCAWSERAVAYAAKQAARFPVDRLETVDEIGSLPSQYPWQRVVVPWRANCTAPIVHPNIYPVGWETPDKADACSRYFSVWDPGEVKDQQAGLLQAVHNARDDWRLYLALSCVGPNYTKRGPSADYVKGWPVRTMGIYGRHLIGQMYTALGEGASGVNVYAYDNKVLWRDVRVDAPIGTSGLQTGSWPGDSRWQGVSAAVRSATSRTFGSECYVPVQVGPWLCGRRGSLWWAVNRTAQVHRVQRMGVVVTAVGETYADTVPSGCAILWSV